MKTLFVNGKVFLGINKFADAVGFDDETGKIIFTGISEQSDLIKNEYSEVIDVKNKLVLPSFTDGHCHFIEGSFLNSRLNLRNAATKNDFKEGIKKYRSINNNQWIFGGYFSESNFLEKIKPDKFFLDEICDDIPLIISRFDTHSAFANSKALEMSGIVNSRSEFTSFELIQDENGFTGELKERAMNFVLDKIPAASLSERTAVVLKELSNLHSLGITAISDITLSDDLEIYKELIKKNKLLLKVDSRLPFSEFHNMEKVKEEFSEFTDLIKFNSLKAFYDGSLSSRTAYMHSNYKNSNHNGIRTEFVNSGEFEKAAFEIDKAGYQMSVHAIGDKAVTELLDLNEELIRINGVRDRRFRIEHAQHIAENDFERFKKLNVIASVQPSHLFSDAKTSSEILNDFTSEHNYKKLFDIGARVCFGTDFPIVGVSPFETIYYAVTRKATAFPEGFMTENCISAEESITAYTEANAYASFDENERGNIQPGKSADLIVMEDDILNINTDEIINAKVFMTYFNGKRIF
ncbi:MAG: amidohydrolase [Ignavibacteria bacterium]